MGNDLVPSEKNKKTLGVPGEKKPSTQFGKNAEPPQTTVTGPYSEPQSRGEYEADVQHGAGSGNRREELPDEDARKMQFLRSQWIRNAVQKASVYALTQLDTYQKTGSFSDDLPVDVVRALNAYQFLILESTLDVMNKVVNKAIKDGCIDELPNGAYFRAQCFHSRSFESFLQKNGTCSRFSTTYGHAGMFDADGEYMFLNHYHRTVKGFFSYGLTLFHNINVKNHGNTLGLDRSSYPVLVPKSFWNRKEMDIVNVGEYGRGGGFLYERDKAEHLLLPKTIENFVNGMFNRCIADFMSHPFRQGELVAQIIANAKQTLAQNLKPCGDSIMKPLLKYGQTLPALETTPANDGKRLSHQTGQASLPKPEDGTMG